MISTKGRYALRALVDIAEHSESDGAFAPLSDVARRQGISKKYLESIVSTLTRAGLVQGLRGKGGGYRLVVPPEQITVARVVRLMEGTLAPVACLECEGSSQGCERKDSCRTLPMWKGLDRVVSDYLEGITVRDLMREGPERGREACAEQPGGCPADVPARPARG
jgi:Rrf2 family iron-sulfur cluster assembly transcriptional regulator